MANNYCTSSNFISIPEDFREAAEDIVARVEQELEDVDDGYVGFIAEVQSDGVWIYHDEYIDTEHLAHLVETLVDELNLPGIHVCSWAYTCSKPGVDEFGGGAFAVQKGHDTIWIDAATEVTRLAALRGKSI